MKYFFLVIGFLFSADLAGQAQPVANFSFDNCTIADETGNYPDGTVEGSPECTCGTAFNGYSFNGGVSAIELPAQLKSIFENDFSLSFYLWVEDAAMPYPIFSIKDTCSRDSSFVIRFIPQSNLLEIEFSKNIADGVFFRTELDRSLCWHHIVFTKKGNIYSVFVNGSFVESTSFIIDIPVSRNGLPRIGDSPCIGISDQNFRGRIDEFRIFDSALDEDDISDLQQFPDMITTMDTTIFLGDNVALQTGGTCAPNFLWAPAQYLSDPGELEPVAQPDNTVTYTLTLNHGDCITSDQVTINVIDESALLCENILLPTAFSPNGDGLNDRYGISNSFIVSALSYFEIYDRWGSLVFKTSDKNATWDGYFKGEKMIPGVYAYRLSYTCGNEEYFKSGSLNILR